MFDITYFYRIIKTVFCNIMLHTRTCNHVAIKIEYTPNYFFFRFPDQIFFNKTSFIADSDEVLCNILHLEQKDNFLFYNTHINIKHSTQVMSYLYR